MARSVDDVEVNGYTIEPGANLEKAQLERADLTKARLEGANLERADLSGANLGGANLYGAELRWVNLLKAKANKETIWPDRFDPEAAGVIFED